MNDWERLSKQGETYQKAYPVGTRIMLLCMGDDPRPIPPNTRGTVRTVDSIGTVHCDFDNGRRLGLVPGEDSFRKLTEQELAEENKAVDKLLTNAQKRSQEINADTNHDQPKTEKELV